MLRVLKLITILINSEWRMTNSKKSNFVTEFHPQTMSGKNGVKQQQFKDLKHLFPSDEIMRLMKLILHSTIKYYKFLNDHKIDYHL